MQSDKPSNESISFRVAVVLVAGVGIAVTGTNLGYYNRIREETPNTDCNLISNSEANTAWWMNLIALIIFAIIFIWALISGPMSISRKKRMETERTVDFVERRHVPFDPKIKHLPLVSHKFGEVDIGVISASEHGRVISAASSGHGRGSSVTVASPTVFNTRSPTVVCPSLG